MDWFRLRTKTKLDTAKRRTILPIHGALQWSGLTDTDNNTKNNNNTKRHRHNLNLQSISTSVLTVLSLFNITTPVLANTDVGGVSATANPVANSSGSVTNQAIQVLQGPYITNTYSNGIQCQGATMNLTPFFTGSLSEQHPYEDYWMDPVYNMLDANDDGVPDNPGEILFYKPTRTGQKNNQNISIGISGTISWPLDKKLTKLCKEAAAQQIAYIEQTNANKRLDFEIARLKNCGELMKAGIMFHPKSPYHSVCADVVLVNPPNTLPNHTHSIPSTSYSFSEVSQVEDPSSPDTYLIESPDETKSDGVPVSSGQHQLPSLLEVSKPSESNPLGVLQIGQTQ